MQKRNKQIIFTAGSGRSGTTTIVAFIRNNIDNATAFHEPSFRPHGLKKLFKKYSLPENISVMAARGFAEAITWFDDDDPMYERLTDFRTERIKNCKAELYLEANHAFLKTFYQGFMRTMPELKVIYLVRSPFEVAQSFYNRRLVEDLNDDAFYAVYKRWNVSPGLKKNVLPPLLIERPSRFQLYLWSWIEMELRYVRFRQEFSQVPVFEMKTEELNTVSVMKNLLDFLGQERTDKLILPGVKNANKIKTKIQEEHYHEAQLLLREIDEHYLEMLPNPYNIFQVRTGSIG